MTRKKARLPLIAVAVLLALAAVLAWYLRPRPLLREGDVYRITYWDGNDDVELIDQVDHTAFMELLNEYRCSYGGSADAYSLEKYPLELGFHDLGGSWYVVAGPEGAFAYDSSGHSNWQVINGEQLWLELSLLRPLGTEAAAGLEK